MKTPLQYIPLITLFALLCALIFVFPKAVKQKSSWFAVSDSIKWTTKDTTVYIKTIRLESGSAPKHNCVIIETDSGYILKFK